MPEEMRYIEGELLPMLRERAAKHEAAANKQLRQWRGEHGVCSLLLTLTDVPEAEKLPEYNQEEIHADPEKMFVHQLRGALGAALADGDAVPSVRANVGCGALCTLLGGLRQTFFPDKMPWLLQHLSGEELAQMTAESIEDSAEFKMGLEQMKYMKEMLRGTGIGLYPMDLQGPVDMAHLLMGDEFFYSVYDDEELTHHVLDLAVSCDIYGMERCLEIIAPGDFVCHYNNLVLPSETPLKVSEDTSTLLCGEHLEEYMRPHTERLLAHFGGGYIHYCGDNQHLLSLMPKIRGSIGLNFGNPERHDPQAVLNMLGENGQFYYGSFPGLSLFEQVRMAKRPDGTHNMFVTAYCTRAEQQKLLDEWNEAVLRCGQEK